MTTARPQTNEEAALAVYTDGVDAALRLAEVAVEDLARTLAGTRDKAALESGLVLLRQLKQRLLRAVGRVSEYEEQIEDGRMRRPHGS